MYKKFSITELIIFTKSLKILYVEDNQIARESFLGLLSNFFTDIVIGVDGEDGFTKFQNSDFDIVISDIRMPKLNGIEMSKKIRDMDCTIPIIIATAHKENNLLLECIEVGVSAYLLKPINFKQLEKVVKQTCERIYYMKKTEEYETSLEELVKVRTKELEVTTSKLKEAVNRDPMTNLYNRRYFHDVSESLLKISKREEKTLSILMIDIDKFKNINDTYGHMLGDKVILLLANIFYALVRTSDIPVRFGGEEFVILLPNTDIKGAMSIANKIRETVENQKMILDDTKENIIRFTVSIGIVEHQPSMNTDINELLHSVDKALYQAKRDGRNRVVVYEGE